MDYKSGPMSQKNTPRMPPADVRSTAIARTCRHARTVDIDNTPRNVLLRFSLYDWDPQFCFYAYMYPEELTLAIQLTGTHGL
jgi:hypothetical protein